MKKKIGIGVVILLIAIGGLAAFYMSQKGVPTLSVDPSSLPKFITASYIDLGQVGYISKFRSDSGHDFSDGTTTCASMKHYFDFTDDKLLRIRDERDVPPAPTKSNGVPVYAPTDGTIVAIVSEQFPLGKQIHIKSKSAPTFTVRLFHIYPLDNIKEGTEVTSGMQIGLISMGQGSDIAVEANALSGRKYYSIFEVMSDQLFQQYQALGFKRDDFILSEAYRKEHPNQCNGEQFVQQNTSQGDERTEWVKLR